MLALGAGVGARGSPGQLLGEHGEGLALAVFAFELGEIRLPQLVLAQEEDGGFGESPFELGVANLFARQPVPLARRFFGTFGEPTVRDEVLHARKAGNGVDLKRITSAKILPMPGTDWRREKVCTSCPLAVRVI